MDLFLKASRKKYRFASSKGLLTVENLWDLPLQSKNGLDLDTVAQTLDQELSAAGKRSFVDSGSNPAKTEIEEKLAIVVYVIETVKAENEQKASAAVRKAERENLLRILHDKQQQSLLGLSKDELKARIAALGG